MDNRRLGILTASIIVIGASILLIAFTVAKVLGNGDDADLKRLESDYQKHTLKNNETVEELKSKMAELAGNLKQIEDLKSKMMELTGNLKQIEEQVDQQNNSRFLNQMSKIETKMEEKISNISKELQAMIKEKENAEKLAHQELSTRMQRLQIIILHSSHENERTTPAPEEAWNITYACQVYKDPELTDLRSEVPEKISVIFSNNTKAIETRKWRRQLTIDNDMRLRATKFYNMTTGLKHWQFQAVDDACEYFIIRHVEMNVGLGVVTRSSTRPSNQSKRLDYKALNEIRKNPRYHWKILLTEHSFIQKTYYQFINNDTGMALAANDDSDVFPFTINGDDSEKWEIE